MTGRPRHVLSISLGFLGCWLGTMLSTERGNDREFDELLVRSETGIGAEKAGMIAEKEAVPA